MLVEEAGDGVGVAHDSSHVRRRGEAANAQGPIPMAMELEREVRLVNVTVRILPYRDDLCDRLTPRQLVGVVLERTDENDRTLLVRNEGTQAVAIFQLGRDPQAKDTH